MKKNKFITSTLILILGGFITKILGFVIRIIYTRIIGEDGVSLYFLVMPTYSLLLTFATLSLPIAISKLVSESKERSLKILSNATIITIFINILIIILTFIFAKPIAYNLLKEPKCYYLIIAMSLTFPFVSISSIIKGYFYGKQKMTPHTISNIVEQIVRIILIIYIIPILMKKNIIYAVVGLILTNIASELASILTFFFFMPKKVMITKQDLKINSYTTKSILGISLPNVSSRIIGNIGFFFEPIILTNVLLSVGYTSSYIVKEYGIYNAYSISTLTIPSFFIMAISSALLPEISKFYNNKNIVMVKRRIKQALIISGILGIFFSSCFYIYRYKLLDVIYKTTSGANYIKILVPFFCLFYLEGPLISSLQALNKSKVTMFITIIGVIIKLIIMALLSLFHIGIYSLVISEIINIILVVFLNFIALKNVLSK
ncbi:MAG: oligosaccharide flippase family protein [Bacilli bacterium]|nr:oligosaccharide flippase family protein [Bacilli bacterium]